METSIDSLGYEFKNKIQVEFILLVARGIEEILQLYHISMVQFAHYLQFSVLMSNEVGFLFSNQCAYFESFILKDFFDGHIFI